MKSTTAIRSKILETATHLFYTQGYNSTGINQIIDESNIAKASLYHHFKSKSDLLYAYLEEFSDRWFVQLHSHIDPLNDPKEKILGLFDFRMNRQVVSNYGGCPFIKASAEVAPEDQRAFELINQNKMKFRDLILELLQPAAFKKGALTKEELADTLYLLIEGATVTAGFQKTKAAMTNAKAIAEKLVEGAMA
ncbi:TetR/AcrR family transcriptional regulator [Paraflavisolibacter sp. H34]|uniref:TetR/AcrR family transcriptional regulator n=1 Tax=Huijunlia imazamoxiresistens TaxID=3127457 RepID=UPI003016D9D5